MITLVAAANVSAASIGSQSVDVTVGEVDQISTDDNKDQDVHIPNTGLFGLEANSTSIIVTTFLTIPIVVVLACIFSYARHKHAKID